MAAMLILAQRGHGGVMFCSMENKLCPPGIPGAMLRRVPRSLCQVRRWTRRRWRALWIRARDFSVQDAVRWIVLVMLLTTQPSTVLM